MADAVHADTAVREVGARSFERSHQPLDVVGLHPLVVGQPGLVVAARYQHADRDRRRAERVGQEARPVAAKLDDLRWHSSVSALPDVAPERLVRAIGDDHML